MRASVMSLLPSSVITQTEALTSRNKMNTKYRACVTPMPTKPVFGKKISTPEKIRLMKEYDKEDADWQRSIRAQINRDRSKKGAAPARRVKALEGRLEKHRLSDKKKKKKVDKKGGVS